MYVDLIAVINDRQISISDIGFLHYKTSGCSGGGDDVSHLNPTITRNTLILKKLSSTLPIS